MQPIVFDLPTDRRLTGVQREVRAKGHVWVAEDVRMQWLILSQRSAAPFRVATADGTSTVYLSPRVRTGTRQNAKCVAYEGKQSQSVK